MVSIAISACACVRRRGARVQQRPAPRRVDAIHRHARRRERRLCFSDGASSARRPLKLSAVTRPAPASSPKARST